MGIPKRGGVTPQNTEKAKGGVHRQSKQSQKPREKVAKANKIKACTGFIKNGDKVCTGGIKRAAKRGEILILCGVHG